MSSLWDSFLKTKQFKRQSDVPSLDIAVSVYLVHAHVQLALKCELPSLFFQKIDAPTFSCSPLVSFFQLDKLADFTGTRSLEALNWIGHMYKPLFSSTIQ